MDGNIGIASVLALASVVSLAGVIYPFKPFKKRWVALISLIACFVLTGIFAPSPETTETTAADASGIEELVAGSDDFARYRTAFAQAAQSLITQRRCTKRDFRDMGGWVKSSNHRNQPIYFTYCGGATVANRLYLNADTGEVFR